MRGDGFGGESESEGTDDGNREGWLIEGLGEGEDESEEIPDLGGDEFELRRVESVDESGEERKEVVEGGVGRFETREEDEEVPGGVGGGVEDAERVR